MPGPRPDVSVIIPMYNGGALIHEQLDALAGQVTDLTWEVVVGDNGSTDGSAEAVRARAADFPVPLRVVEASARKGASHARNAAAALATGDLLAMCDADERVAPDWVAQAHRAVQEIAPMVAGANRRLQDPFREGTELLNSGILHGRGAQTCNAAVRRDVFLEVGGFDESLPPYGVEDSDLSSRVLAAGHRIGPAPDMVVYFRETTGIRSKLRMISSSGQAESVLWARRAQQAGTPLTQGFLVGQLLRYPADAVREGRARGVRRMPQWLMRQAAVRYGRLKGYREWVATGRAGDPVLLFLDSSEAPA